MCRANPLARIDALQRAALRVADSPGDDGGLEELGLVGTGRLARLGLRLRLARRLRTSSEQARADAATRRFRARSVHRGEWSYTRASCGGGGNRRSESCASQSRIRS